MFLAVLSSLLNLILGGISEIDADESTDDDSTEFPTVEMDRLEKGGNTSAQWNKCS